MSSLLHLNRKIKTIVSPYHELLCSLHVLYQPEHHPKRLQWASEITADMPQALREGIQTIGQLSDQWLLLSALDRSGEALSCTDGFARIRALPDAELIFLLLNDRVSLGTVLEWLHGQGTQGSGERPDESGQYLLKNLNEVRLLLLYVLETYERDYFRSEWEYIYPWISTASARFQEEANRSPEKALSSLHTRLHAGEGTITAQKAHTYYFPYERLQQIYIRPSTFIYPHLLIDWTEDTLLLPLAVDIPDLPYSEAPPGDLLQQLKALGDGTRLRILKLLWQAPHCTKQLAPLLHISEAAVSKQLKLLQEAGLAGSERKGNYLFYFCRKEAFDSLIVLQRQFFEQ